MAEGNLKMCQDCRGLIDAGAATCPLCGMPAHYAGGAKETVAAGGWTLTGLLLLANMLVYVASLVLSTKLAPSSSPGQGGDFLSPSNRALYDLGAVNSELVRAGQSWRLISYCFLHGDLIHILMNSFGLIQAGRLAEEIYGGTKYYCLYLFSGIAGGLMVVASNGQAVGASGALFGLIGALAVYGYKRRDTWGRQLKASMIQWLMYGIIISFLPGISWAGHLGGLLGGAAMAWLIDDAEQTNRSHRRVRLWQLAGLAALLLTCGSLVQAALNVRTETALARINYLADQMFQAKFDYDRWDELEQNETPTRYTGSFDSAVTKLENTEAVDAESGALKQRLVDALDLRRRQLREKKEQPLAPPPYEQQVAVKQSFDDFQAWLKRQAASFNRPVEELHQGWKITKGERTKENQKQQSAPSPNPSPQNP